MKFIKLLSLILTVLAVVIGIVQVTVTIVKLSPQQDVNFVQPAPSPTLRQDNDPPTKLSHPSSTLRSLWERITK